MSAIVYGITKPPACIYYDEKIDSGMRCQCLRDDDLCCLHNEETRKKLYSASWNEQYAMCPLKEIPTSHGNLIDADTLFETIKKNSYLLANYGNSLENGMFLTGIKQAIDEAQTIIEAEVSE